MNFNLETELNNFLNEKKIIEISSKSFEDISKKWNGKGIVIPSGGKLYLSNAYMNIKYIRNNINCKIPIEIWYLGKKEINKKLFEELNKLGNISFIDALEHQKKYPFKKCFLENATPIQSPANVDGWRLKIYSIIHSKFSEIIYLDSDCFLFQNPINLFECNEYKENKAIFSCDIDVNHEKSGRLIEPDTFIVKKLGTYTNRKWDYSKPNPLWKMLGIEEDDSPEFESGFMMIDKIFHINPLFITLFLNENSDITYRYLMGDKDTFHLAWAKNKSSYYMLKNVKRNDEHIVCYFNNEILFEHRVYNTKFNISISWDEFPNNKNFNNKHIFKEYFQYLNSILNLNTKKIF
jgi:hypothetical protein